MSKHPEWATKHKRKGTELRLLKGKYYLYEATSKWNPEKKRSQKITGKLLGRITREDGFIESEKRKLQKERNKIEHVSVKEYGITHLINESFPRYKDLLKKHFPEHWAMILALTYGRFVHQSPMKNMEAHYLNSYLSESYPGLKISGRNLTEQLREIGAQREKIVDFFQEFSSANDNILFDGTDMLSNSKKMDLPKKSKTKKGVFDQVVNFMFIFSTNLQLPTYYKALSGNIKDIKAFKLCLKESGIKDATIIADKGFYSIGNVAEMKKEQLKYIIPLRRNSSLISYEKIEKGDKSRFDGYFMYEKRVIWYYQLKTESENVYIFLDEELKNNEIKDYLNRIDSLPEKYNIETFHQKQYVFGTVAMASNTDKEPEEIYKEYKSRGQIEGMIDVLKNTFDADKSYMQDEKALEAWMLINFITLHWYYKIIHKLKECRLNTKFSPKDIILFLSNIKKVRINKTWYNAEITKKNEKVLTALGLHIT